MQKKAHHCDLSARRYSTRRAAMWHTSATVASFGGMDVLQPQRSFSGRAPSVCFAGRAGRSAECSDRREKSREDIVPSLAQRPEKAEVIFAQMRIRRLMEMMRVAA